MHVALFAAMTDVIIDSFFQFIRFDNVALLIYDNLAVNVRDAGPAEYGHLLVVDLRNPKRRLPVYLTFGLCDTTLVHNFAVDLANRGPEVLRLALLAITDGGSCVDIADARLGFPER